MKLEETIKVKEEVQRSKQHIDYVITHKLLDGKAKPTLKTLGFKRLREARRVANTMNRNGTFIKLVNKKGTVLTI